MTNRHQLVRFISHEVRIRESLTSCTVNPVYDISHRIQDIADHWLEIREVADRFIRW